MRSKIVIVAILIAVTGCAAEQRTIYFLPVDLVVVAPREPSLPRLARTRVTDDRPTAGMQIARGAGKEAELAMYPDAAKLVDAIVTANADAALDSYLADRDDLVIECTVLRFDILTKRKGIANVLDVFVQIELRADSSKEIVSGASRQEFNKTLVRKDFQDVIHAALKELSDEVTLALKNLDGKTNT